MYERSFYYEIGKDMHNEEKNPLNLQRVELETIGLALKQTGNNISKAGEILGINRRTLQRKLQRYFVRKEM